MRLTLAIVCVFFVGCSSTQKGIYDPWEGMNRGIFKFNEKADTYVIEPVAKVYDHILPDPAQKSVSNFFANWEFPSVFVSSVLQLKFGQALTQTGRFAVNTTLGLAGLFDPATDMGLKKSEDDFGVALGYNGVPEGPYFVIPFLGPSNVRDAFGRLVDLALDPLFFLEYVGSGFRNETALLNSGFVLKFINARSNMIENVNTAKESSVDYYLFLQGAYHQYRQGLIYDGNAPDEDDVDSPSDPPSSPAKNDSKP